MWVAVVASAVLTCVMMVVMLLVVEARHQPRGASAR
jgi:hypothetical protein